MMAGSSHTRREAKLGILSRKGFSKRVCMAALVEGLEAGMERSGRTEAPDCAAVLQSLWLLVPLPQVVGSDDKH